MALAQTVLVFGLDLGTGLAACFVTRQLEKARPNGELIRTSIQGESMKVVNDWGFKAGDPFVPTALVYSIRTRQLLYWGFQATTFMQKITKSPTKFPPRSDFHIVENVKVLLRDPSCAGIPPETAERYRNRVAELHDVLGKTPWDCFTDFTIAFLHQCVAVANKNGYANNNKIEVAVALPSGYSQDVHSKAEATITGSMRMAIDNHKLQNTVFGIENVYMVSETECGIKAWLYDAVVGNVTSVQNGNQSTITRLAITKVSNQNLLGENVWLI